MRIQPVSQTLPQNRPLGREVKEQIVEKLKLVSMHTAWGYACLDFAENWQAKSDPDFRELMWELKMQIAEGPQTMRSVLGKAYRYFSTEVK